MEFEDVLKEVGGFETYQKKLIWLFIVPVAHALPFFWTMILLMLQAPEHMCKQEQSSILINLSSNYTLPKIGHSCLQYNSSAIENYGNFNYSKELLTEPCRSGWVYDTTDFDNNAVTEWDLVCDKSHYPSLVLTLQNVGGLVGTPILGTLSDRFGRKKIFFLIILVISVTDLLSVLTRNFITFAVLRAINGSVLRGLMTLHAIIVLEVVSPEKRGYVNGLINVSWSIGACLIGLVAYLGRSWIVYGYINVAISAVIILVYIRFVQESPSWLISRNRQEEAVIIMMKIAKSNKKNLEPSYVTNKIQMLSSTIQKRKEADDNSGKKPSILKSPRLMRMILLITISYMGNSIGFGGLVYNIGNLSGNIFFNYFLLSVVELPGCIILWYSMDTFGRRWTAAVGFTISGFLCLLAIIGFPYSDVIASILGKMVIAGVYMVTDQQACELYPTESRSSLMALSKTMALLFTMFSPFIANLNAYGKEVPFLIISLTSIATGVLSTFLPETLNVNLPQTIADSEQFGKDQRYFSWHVKKPLKKEETKENYVVA